MSRINNILEKVQLTIKSHNLIENGDSVVVALSGGPDSVCLLHVLHTLSEKLNIKIYAVHINHMLRGLESDADEAYVFELCGKLDVPIHSRSFDIRRISDEKGISLEEAGREIRYGELSDFAYKTGASKVAVAHNKNDQTETVLMHILRGSGLAGLAGMEYERGNIIRPLLDIERSEIEEYCEKLNLNPRIDSSNLKSDFTRNRIRLELIPFINAKFNVDLMESICRLSSHAGSENGFMEKCSAEAMDKLIVEKSSGNTGLNLSGLKSLHPALQRRVIRKAVCQVKGDLKGIESIHVDDAVGLISRGRTGAAIQLPGGIFAGISYNLFKIYMKTESADTPQFDKIVTMPGCTEVAEINSVIIASIEAEAFTIDKYNGLGYNSLVQFFDYDGLKRGINIRNRCEGDIFKPYKSSGTKKLKEYFIDNKIPREIRSEIPLIACNDEIVWIIGYKISDKFKVTENTKSVLKLEVKKVGGTYNGGYR
jgi:tRNA(Ile)-lysidine synthase